MISFFLRGFLVVSGFLSLSQAMDWEQRSDVPASGRHHPITFANETHAFFLTGTTTAESGTSDFYIYEESTDQWTQVTGGTGPFPGRSFGYGVVLNEADNTKAYLGFGLSNGAPLNDLWELDMATLEWKQLADCPGQGRRHPAMNAVLLDNGNWEIHIGLGDGIGGNYNDWWTYDIATDVWTERDDFPGSNRHHPYYFSMGDMSYAGLGHSDGFLPYIERDFYVFEPSRSWTRLDDFESVEDGTVVTREARVAGTQFSVTLKGKTIGFVLSGDGDNHSWMATGEFHSFDGDTWSRLTPHPGRSRWAPGSFVIRGSARAYFTAGYDRATQTLYNDLWRIDLETLFSDESGGSDPTNAPTSGSPSFNPECFSRESVVQVQDRGFIKMKDLQLNDMVHVGNNNYEPVYSFGHRMEDTPSDFLRLLPSQLELSRDHLVFVQGKGAIPASAVEIGDRLVSSSAGTVTKGINDLETVTAIHGVRRKGMYAPFTYSGTIAVNGVLASNYVSFQDDSAVVLLGSSFQTSVSYHWISHTFQGPHRTWCKTMGCSEETYDSEGHSSWVARPFRLLQMGLSADRSITFQSLFLLACAITIMLMSNLVILLTSVALAIIGYVIIQKRGLIVSLHPVKKAS